MGLEKPIDQYTNVTGIKTRYWEMGQAKNPAVILLHGGSGSVEFWAYNIGVFAQHYHVYAFDMVGSGRSDKPSASYSIDYQANFLKAFMAAIDLPKATLIGNSMGGSVALQLAAQHPTLVHKLVLVDCFGLGRNISWVTRLASLPFAVRLLRPNRRLLQATLDFHQSPPAEWFDLRYPIFALPGRQPAIEQLARSNLSLLGVPTQVFRSIQSQLPHIVAPTLILWGENDRVLPVAQAAIALEKISNARLHIFQDCGHHPHVEYPQAFNQIVLDFLAN